jgi:hypothetical protein
MIRSKRKAGSFDLAQSVSHNLSSPFRSADKAVDSNAVMAILESTDKEIQQVPLVSARIDERGHGVGTELRFTRYGLSSACSKIGLPSRLLNEVAETNPKLASEMFNHRLRTHGHKFTAITHQGRVEGVVSEGYQRLPTVQAVSTLLDRGGSIQSFRMDGLRTAITSMKRESFAEVQRGDVVGMGSSMKNAEDGHWAFDLNLFMLRLVCTNGMVSQLGNIEGYAQHRRNIVQRATEFINKADMGSNELLHTVRHSLTVNLAPESIIKIRDNVAEHFENLAWGNKVAEAIPREAHQWSRTTPTVFDAWNAVTGLHTECNNNIDRILEVQSYAREVLALAA